MVFYYFSLVDVFLKKFLKKIDVFAPLSWFSIAFQNIKIKKNVFDAF